MDKNSIKKFAVWAHRELIGRVSTRAQWYGVMEGEESDPEETCAHGMLLSAREINQRRALIDKINRDGYWRAMEEAAYTWFNRFCALRFMEANGYLPSHIRVFTDENHTFKPQILSEAIHLEGHLEGVDIDKVFLLKETNKTEELYKYLIITQCNALKGALPKMFTKIEDYSELLFPDFLLREGSVIERMVAMIPEDDWKDQVEIIGWLYQYYNSEKHEAVVDPLYGKAIKVEDIPAATQLFTPDWVVRYLVDNSVGRYWIARYPSSKLSSELEYYVESGEKIPCEGGVAPQDVTVFDPCVGSGHFLVYAIDVLMKIYREYGYSERDAICEIIRGNVAGTDIDARAVELAYFAIMMKGCQYDKRFLRRGIHPRVHHITDSHFVNDGFMDYLSGNHETLKRAAIHFTDVMKDALEAGSLIQISGDALELLEERLESLPRQKDIIYSGMLDKFGEMLEAARLLSLRYAVVITNPPYMNQYDAVLKSYLKRNYKDYSGDLFSVFIYRCIQFCQSGGCVGLMTPNVWMFIKSYAKLRQYILNNHSITTLVQMAKGAFFSEATVDVCAFVIESDRIHQAGVYFRLDSFPGNMDEQNRRLLEALHDPSCRYRYLSSSLLFEHLPGMPIGYWASAGIIRAFKGGEALERRAAPRQGLATTDNSRYLRHWYEVEYGRIGFGLDRKAAALSGLKWFPYNKGGEFRRWYGNQDYIVNYQNDGSSIKKDVLRKYPYLKTPDFVVKNSDTYFCKSLSWSKISSGSVSFRYFGQGFLYDVSGCSIFFNTDHDLYYCAGFLNGAVSAKILEIISPTLNYETGHIGILPVIDSRRQSLCVERLVQENIGLSQEDWDKYETSWSFRRHPLV